jgi:hypothetical protein
MLESFRERVIHPTRNQMVAVLKLARDRGAIPADADTDTMIEMLIGSYLYRTLAGRPIPKNWPERMVAAIWPEPAA